ncbi:MAG: oligopeptide:H+ symporter [Burkholderiales bacterium]|nr:oligopeptide:H+ symporter [Burkholderiales bacterium]
MSIEIDVKTVKVGFWHLPKTFYALLFIEFWERFAFYGLQSVAVIYFVQKFHFTESHSGDLFSSFSALLYALMILGGYVGDRILGLRLSYLLGILFFIVGYSLISLANSENLLYSAMGLILVGNVFFKTNATNYVSRCFEANDPRLDSAYTYFYMSINTGSFFSILLVPVISKIFGYNIGLSLCAVGMVCALGFYFLFKERFALLDNQIGKNKQNKLPVMVVLTLLGCLLGYVAGLVLSNVELSKDILFIGGFIFVVVYLIMAFRLPRYELKGMLLAFILLLQSIVFLILYMQTSTSFVLFAYHNINLSFLGYNVPAGVTQVFNPICIMILSPVLANLYLSFHKQGCDIGIPYKFLVGIFSTGICFILLAIAANFFADSNSQISFGWLFVAYIFYSLGEMLVAALGPSMVAKLLPKRFGGVAQGFWFLFVAIGLKLGGVIASKTASEYNVINPAESLKVYMHLFYSLGIIVVIISIVFYFITKPLVRVMNEVMEHRS